MARRKPTAPPAKTPTLDRLVEDFRQSVATAASQQDWQTALDATFSGLLWRSVRLAIRLNIVPGSFNPAISWNLTALQLLSICRRALAREGSDADEEADYRIEVVIDVLNALTDVAAALESGQSKMADGAFQLTIGAANLGRCELMLGFAEDGFWEQVYEWRRRQGGKPTGKGLATWKADALPIVRGWVDEELLKTGKVKISDLEERLQDWLQAKGISKSRDAVKTAIRQMRMAKEIPVPFRTEKVN
jgi:hypothetical protein